MTIEDQPTNKFNIILYYLLHEEEKEFSLTPEGAKIDESLLAEFALEMSLKPNENFRYMILGENMHDRGLSCKWLSSHYQWDNEEMKMKWSKEGQKFISEMTQKFPEPLKAYVPNFMSNMYDTCSLTSFDTFYSKEEKDVPMHKNIELFSQGSALREKYEKKLDELHSTLKNLNDIVQKNQICREVFRTK